MIEYAYEEKHTSIFVTTDMWESKLVKQSC